MPTLSEPSTVANHVDNEDLHLTVKPDGSIFFNGSLLDDIESLKILNNLRNKVQNRIKSTAEEALTQQATAEQKTLPPPSPNLIPLDASYKGYQPSDETSPILVSSNNPLNEYISLLKQVKLKQNLVPESVEFLTPDEDKLDYKIKEEVSSLQGTYLSIPSPTQFPDVPSEPSVEQEEPEQTDPVKDLDLLQQVCEEAQIKAAEDVEDGMEQGEEVLNYDVNQQTLKRSDSFELLEDLGSSSALKDAANDPYMISAENVPSSTLDHSAIQKLLELDSDGNPSTITPLYVQTANHDDTECVYRNQPPSVDATSVCSDATYQSALSPYSEASEDPTYKVSPYKGKAARRRSRPSTSNSAPYNAGERSGLSTQSYPTIPCINSVLSRSTPEDYYETAVNACWWEMLKAVDELYRNHVDPLPRKVEQLRKDVHNLMAVSLYSPTDWGNNQKRKGIYRLEMKAQYDWDENVPFHSVNNNPKQGVDAPRAQKHHLVAMYNYLMKRYGRDVRPLIRIKENGKLVQLPGVEFQAECPDAVAKEPINIATVNKAMATMYVVKPVTMRPTSPQQPGVTMATVIDSSQELNGADMEVAMETTVFTDNEIHSTVLTQQQPEKTMGDNLLTQQQPENTVVQTMGDNLLTQQRSSFNDLNISARQINEPVVEEAVNSEKYKVNNMNMVVKQPSNNSTTPSNQGVEVKKPEVKKEFQCEFIASFMAKKTPTLFNTVMEVIETNQI